MKLDQLPIEMLMKIFNFMPTLEVISLVNKVFYSVACRINDPIICLRINRKFVERFQWRFSQSMKKSNRQITKVRIVGIVGRNDCTSIANERRIVSIAGHFSSTITFLQFAYVQMHESIFLEILSLLPNVENLTVVQIDLTNERYPSKKRREDGDLKLNHLKCLSIIECEEKIIEILNRLPVAVLRELQIQCSWSTLITVLSRQWNIKKLKLEFIHGYIGSTKMFDRLKLEWLEMNLVTADSAAVATILLAQSNLKSLTISTAGAVDEQVMNAIAELTHLEELTVAVHQIPIVPFMMIQNLTKLKEINLLCYGIEPADIRTLAELNNTLIKKLNLSCRTAMSADVIAALAKSVPHLRYLEVPQIEVNFELDTLLRHFNSVEVLKFSIRDEPLSNTVDYFNPKLRELNIVDKAGSRCCYMWLTECFVAYPNIKKLKFTTVFIVYVDIRQILHMFPRLESLIIRGTQSTIVEGDLECLCDLKNNLKFVSWDYHVQDSLTDDFIVKKLRAHFRWVYVEDVDTLFKTNFAKKTLKCER